MMPSPRPRSTRQARAPLEFAVGTVARANPAVTAWRWRYELAGAAGLAAAWTGLGTGPAAMLTAGLAVSLAITACSPDGRRLLAARAWCIVTPHRVRVGCAQAWIHNRYGKLPAVLLTRRQPFGERVYLWCWAGTSPVDFASARVLLAAACWAHDVRVSRHPRYAHLVILDVIRRELVARPAQPTWASSSGGAPVLIPPPRKPADDFAPVGEPPADEPPPRLTA